MNEEPYSVMNSLPREMSEELGFPIVFDIPDADDKLLQSIRSIKTIQKPEEIEKRLQKGFRAAAMIGAMAVESLMPSLPSRTQLEFSKEYERPISVIPNSSLYSENTYLNNYDYPLTESIIEKVKPYQELNNLYSIIKEKNFKEYETPIRNDFDPLFVETPKTAMYRGNIILREDTKKIDQRAAHTFRSARMRMGAMGDLTRDLQNPELAPVKAGVAAIVQSGDRLLAKTQRAGEMHRAYAPLLSGIFMEPAIRKQFMNALDEAVTTESNDLKEQARVQTLETKVLVVGAGVQAAIFSATYRAMRPNDDMLAIEQRSRLGGQFRSYGTRPTFRINSRNFREEDVTIDALPGGEGNLNSFGNFAPLQLPDITSETYPANTELGDVAAVNQHLSTPSMVGVELVGEPVESLDGGKTMYTSTVRDVETGEVYYVRSESVVNLTGLGERPVSARLEESSVVGAEDVLAHFGNEDVLFPMRHFNGKKVLIKGGGDTGRIMAELLSWLAPKEAYGKSTVQIDRGPSRIEWCGTEFADQEEFAKINRFRYQLIASFIRSSKKPDNVGTIYPTKAKATTEILSDGSALATFGDGSGSKNYDIVVDCTQLTNEDLVKWAGSLVDVSTTIGKRGRVTIAKQVRGKKIYYGGPVSQTKLSAQEKRTFAEGIKENTAAIWANGPRTEELAKQLALVA